MPSTFSSPVISRGSRVNRLAGLLLLGVVAYVAVLLAAGAEIATRVLFMRYWMIGAAAFFAMAPPHVLLPDPNVPLLQRLNRPPRGLLAYQLGRWMPIVVAFLLPGALLALYDPGAWGSDLALKSLRLAEGICLVLGAGLYSFERYATIGPRSQEWQEGTRGKRYRAMKEHASASGLFAVPDGMVPAMMATTRVFLVAIFVILVSAIIGGFVGHGWALVPAVLLLVWSGLKVRRRLPAYDRAFYATNAFYSEIFRSAGGVRVSDREPIPYDAVYWTPHRLRPAVWASLRQLDRQLPLGRFMLIGHVVLWILFFQGAALGAIGAYLLLFLTVKNAAIYLLVREELAPPAFQLTRQAPLGWIGTRFFVNLRWTLSVLLSLLLVAFFDSDFSALEALLWTGVDVLVALLLAAVITYGAEFQARKRFA